MADVFVTKAEAARRQLDAAIRILFTGEDPLAIHTVVAAAYRILADLDTQRAHSPARDVYAQVREELRERFPGAAPFSWSPERFRIWLQQSRSRPANFLKHADRDAQMALEVSTLETETDHLLLEACTLYMELHHEPALEMHVFARWHLAVYPHESGDELQTAAGAAHDLKRDAQLQLGAFLLERYREQPDHNGTPTLQPRPL